MNIGTLEKFDEATVAFSAVRAKSTRVVWYDPSALDSATGEQWSLDRFLDEFSFVTPNTPIFSHLSLDRDQVRTFRAERYGGIGIGDNGGGSRGGTLGQFQVKGLGINPLVGRGDDPFHSYGGLDFRESVAELISSIVFGRILPHGTVPCYGLIYTARDAAYSYPPLPDGSFKRCPSALLVRAACARPAHFLRNMLFDPNLREGISGDVQRVRSVNKALQRSFSQRNEFIESLGRFLSACANQFGFASAFRLRHGALSPSNLSFDGRWLDIAFTAFVDSGRNYAAIPSAIPSQEEPMAVLSILQEFVYTFEKYNRTLFNIRPLITYYAEQLGAYATHYSARLVGLPTGAFESAREAGLAGAVDQLSVALSTCIAGDRTLIVGGAATFNEKDPIVLLIEDLFGRLEPTVKPRLANGSFQAQSLIPAFTQLINHSHESRSGNAVSRKSFRLGCAVRSLRKLYFSSIYYFGSMHSVSSEVAALEDPTQGGEIIDEFCDASRWLFDDEDRGDDVLFKSQHLQISFNGFEGAFLAYRNKTAETLRFERADDLLNAMSHFSESDLRVRHFDFRKNLLRMIKVLRLIDQEPGTEH